MRSCTAHVSTIAGLIHDEHRTLAERLDWLASRADELAAAPAAARPAIAHAYYLELAAFTGAYLAHLDVEERVVMPTLAAACDDAELDGTQEVALATVPPPTRAVAMAVMLPALTPPERVALVDGIRATAPPEAFAGVRAIAEQVLTPAEYTRLGIERPMRRDVTHRFPISRTSRTMSQRLISSDALDVRPTRRWSGRPRLTVVGAIGMATFVAIVTASPTVAADSSTAGFDRQVDISPSREMHLACRGRGGPTVVLIAGGVNSGAIWSMPYDYAHPTPTVFPQVASFTRVCTYDRPNTASPAPSDAIALGTSTPITGSVTPANGVVDLHRLLRAAHVRGPYVLVAHSFGGLIARLYSSTYPKEVAGLVLIDSPSELFFDRLTVAQQEMWIAASTGEAAFPGAESFNFPATFAEMRAARKPPRVPTVLFTSDEPFDYSAAVAAGKLGPEFTDFGPLSFRAHIAAQRDLAKRLGARLVLDTHSGHYIFVEHPKRVVSAIRRVVAEARNR